MKKLLEVYLVLIAMFSVVFTHWPSRALHILIIRGRGPHCGLLHMLSEVDQIHSNLCNCAHGHGCTEDCCDPLPALWQAVFPWTGLPTHCTSSFHTMVLQMMLTKPECCKVVAHKAQQMKT
jgi:hypothetical protein